MEYVVLFVVACVIGGIVWYLKETKKPEIRPEELMEAKGPLHRSWLRARKWVRENKG